jgi:tetratricopeptide (TPR) repeat protein
MIREFDENSGSGSPELNLRSLFGSLERELSKEAFVGDQAAGRAQQLVYDAWEAPTDEREKALILEALEIDPTNIDALLQVAKYAGLDDEEEIEVLRKIVATAEKKLGPKVFNQCRGGFWGMIETRPYMRARERLAEALRVAGRLDEAIAEWEGMLELNPNDNQGIRYSLLAIDLALNRLEEVRKLFSKYPEFDFNVVFAWGRVLERFLSGDLAAAKEALAAARTQNPAMQGYIKGQRKMPRTLPEGYSPGSREEAICFAEVLQTAWSTHPSAMAWLIAQK